MKIFGTHYRTIWLTVAYGGALALRARPSDARATAINPAAAA